MWKKAIGIGVIVFASSMFFIETSMATCFETEFKFEHGNREKNIQAIMDYGKCVKAENKARVGKYFCHTENTVGIDVDPENGRTIASGNDKPSVDTFVVTITEVSDDQKRLSCDYGEFGIADNLHGGGNRCLANYAIEFWSGGKISSSIRSSADGYNGYSDYETSAFGEHRSFPIPLI